MGTKRRKRSTSQPEYTFLAISVDQYDATTDAGINLDLHGSTRYFIDDDDPVYTFDTTLKITGVCTYPYERAKDLYDITLISSTTSPRDLRLKVGDLQKRGKDGSIVVRKRRDGSHPVYDEPSPVAYLEKIRGQPRWSAWAWVAPQMTTNSLLILSSGKPAYVSLRECKENRRRKIKSLTVQTTDPAEE